MISSSTAADVARGVNRLLMQEGFSPILEFTLANGRRLDVAALGPDGLMLGVPGAAYHLEFTRAHGHAAGRAPTEDNLLVFYLPDRATWQAAVDRMRACGFEPVSAFNPYWNNDGATFEDPDGYRIVLQNDAWAT